MIIDLSFRDLFGPGVVQTDSDFTIAKSDLPTLTPTSDNNGQELLVGILLRLVELSSGVITAPDGREIKSPTGKPITYIQEANRPSAHLWRVVTTSVSREVVFEVFVWP